jgi:hypothetical protein
MGGTNSRASFQDCKCHGGRGVGTQLDEAVDAEAIPRTRSFTKTAYGRLTPTIRRLPERLEHSPSRKHITFMAKCDGLSPWPMLPPEFWSRTYASGLVQNGGDIKVVMTGLPRPFATGDPSLWGQIRPDGVVTLTNYQGNDQYDPVDERVTPTNFVRILVGAMELSASPKGLSGTFSGSFSLHDRNGTGFNYIIGNCSRSSSAKARPWLRSLHGTQAPAELATKTPTRWSQVGHGCHGHSRSEALENLATNFARRRITTDLPGEGPPPLRLGRSIPKRHGDHTRKQSLVTIRTTRTRNRRSFKLDAPELETR